MKSGFARPRGDRSKLTYDQLRLLEDKVLPTARKWCKHIKGLRNHGVNLLEYWGEDVPNFVGPISQHQSQSPSKTAA